MKTVLAVAIVLQTAGLAGAQGPGLVAGLGIGILLLSRARPNGIWLAALALLQLGAAAGDGAIPGRAARILAPLALLWLGTKPGEALLRLGAGLTFFAHGLEALHGSPAFVTLIVGTGGRLFGWEIPEAAAREALTVVGIADIFLAAAVLTTRWRWVVAYMAFWGILTALSRLTGLGLEALPETLWRVANGAVPLALYLLWKKKKAHLPAKDGPLLNLPAAVSPALRR